MSKRAHAEFVNAQALGLHDQGQQQQAIELYQQAARLDPTWAVPLYNLGLLHKQGRRWEESLKYNQLATQVDAGHEAAWWNLGIAATALGRWDVARAAWRGYGIDVPDGAGPLDFPCGYGPIRLNPDGDGEVVWAVRIDPARAVITNIPFPESGHRWSDVVLNDGAPVGSRTYKGQELPVLNALQLLERRPFATYTARVQMPSRHEYLVQLTDVAVKRQAYAEDWSESVRFICKACSEGRVHQEHDREAARADGVHHLAIAARDRAHASGILRAWESDKDDVKVEWLADPPETAPPQ
jgi:hypothetical protein